MCGRYTNLAEFSETRVAFKAGRESLLHDYRPSYNISPSYSGGFEQPIVVVAKDGQRELRQARWWFIPSFWQKALKELPTSFNARAEDVEKKAFWRDVWSGYYAADNGARVKALARKACNPRMRITYCSTISVFPWG